MIEQLDNRWKPAVVGSRKKDQIRGISSPKLSLLSLNDVLMEMKLIWPLVYGGFPMDL